jgi:thiosulfate/3-mercaptopyruvate sulfurtransferase
VTHHNFVNSDDLAARLGDPNLGIVDASWHLPTAGRNGGDEFRAAHIPGAVFFNIDEIADLDAGLPHMLPDPQKFARAMAALGLGDGMSFVIYDAHGLFAAARVWWTLRAFGVEDVKILEGGLPKWIHEGRPIEAGDAHPAPKTFTPKLDPGFVAGLADVKKALSLGTAQVIDARPADRFEGRTPEPRPGLKSGHMPGALNVPFVEIVERGALKTGSALTDTFEAHGVDLSKPVITTCGSGVTAAILALAVEEAGGTVTGLYDGSWAEWGGRADCPVATG